VLVGLHDGGTAQRKVFHAVNGIILASCCFWFSREEGTMVLAPIVLFVLLSEIVRKFFPAINNMIAAMFGPVMRAHEMNKFSGALALRLARSLACTSSHDDCWRM